MATGVAHFFARRLEQARTILSLSLQQHPNWVPTNRFLAACYAHLGQLDEAKIIIERLRALTPVVLPAADHWRDPEQREFYLSGLRLAMSATDEAASPPWREHRRRLKSLLPANPSDTSDFDQEMAGKGESWWLKRIWANGRTTGFNALRIQAGQ